MRQDIYDIIVTCIEFGSPALASKLILELNKAIEAENELYDIKRRQAYEEQKDTKKSKIDKKPEQQKLPI